MALRPLNERARVCLSANSRSPPTGSPKAMRDTFTPVSLSSLHEVERRGFPLHGGIGGQDHFPHAAFAHSFQEGADAEVRRPNPVDGRNCAHQNVVEAPVLVNGLQGEHVPRLLDHADERPVPGRVGADRAGINVGVRATDAAGADGLAQPGKVLGQRPDQRVIRAQEVIGDAGGAFSPQAGKPRQVPDQPLQGIHAASSSRRHRHSPRKPGEGPASRSPGTPLP